MIEALHAALAHLAQPHVLAAMLAAVPLGLAFGVLPGLGGLTGLALLMPLVYGMEPFQGLTFLVAAHAVVYTGGSVTAILLGIPGAVANAATVADGFALARQGRAGYAVGAALAASALGGLVGVAVLVAMIPVLQPLARAVGSPETALLALAAIALIGALGEGRPVKGLIAGGLGVFLACFGYQQITGVPRFWLGTDYLLDGFRLVPMALGLFAVPEIVSLMAGGRRAADAPRTAPVPWRQVADGIAAVGRRLGLFVRSAVIGVVVGLVPGVGGETAPFVAYAAAKRAARAPEAFGTGAIDGVIAPESGNNAKEGGALVPTLALGIPGSAGMSLLLGGFLILGLEPGPTFLAAHLDVALGLALAVAAANVLGAGLMLAAAPKLAAVARLDGHLLGPTLLGVVLVGAYASANTAADVVAVGAFGALGLAMRALGFSRPALMLGFVLGAPIETYLHISLSVYGPGFLLRPGSLAILAVVAAAVALPWVYRRATGGGR